MASSRREEDTDSSGLVSDIFTVGCIGSKKVEGHNCGTGIEGRATRYCFPTAFGTYQGKPNFMQPSAKQQQKPLPSQLPRDCEIRLPVRGNLANRTMIEMSQVSDR